MSYVVESQSSSLKDSDRKKIIRIIEKISKSTYGSENLQKWYSKLNIDSLQFVEIVFEIEEVFSIKAPEGIDSKFDSIDEIFNFVYEAVYI